MCCPRTPPNSATLNIGLEGALVDISNDPPHAPDIEAMTTLLQEGSYVACGFAVFALRYLALGVGDAKVAMAGGRWGVRVVEKASRSARIGWVNLR